MTWTHFAVADLEGALDRLEVSAWRWECQGHYPVDATLVQRWRDGKPRDPDADRPWVAFVSSLRERAVRFERARMLTEPLTEYLRCMLDYSDMNVDAGEDIRWVPESAARAIDMPTYDFYLLDDMWVAVLDFGDDGRLADIRVTEDVATVSQHRDYRERIWPHATPHTQRK